MTFGRQAVASLAITAAYALLAVAITIATTRLLGLEGFGLYASIIAHMNVLAILVSGGIPQLLVREVKAAVHAGAEGVLGGLIARARLYALGASAVIAAGSLAVFLAFAGPSPWWTGFALALAVMAALGMLDVQGSILRALDRPVLGQIPNALIRPALHLTLLLALFAAPFATEAHHAVAAFLIAALLALGPSTVMLRGRLAHRPPAPAVTHDRVWLTAMGTFILAGGFIRLNQQMGAVMLEHLGSRVDVALYQAAIQLVALMLLARQAIVTILIPRMKAELLDGTPVSQHRLMMRAGALALVLEATMAVALIALGPTGVEAIFGEGYGALHPLLTVMAIGQVGALSMGLPMVALNQAGHEGVTARIMALTLGASLILGVVLIGWIGAMGAAIAYATSAVLSTLAMAVACKRRLGFFTTPMALIWR